MKEKMMLSAVNNDKEKILKYLENSISECIYLYIDIANYDLEAGECEVWYEEGSEITFVLMRYYGSYQIYSHMHSYIPKDILSIINERPGMISGRRELIEELSKKADGYKTSYGFVFMVDGTIRNVSKEGISWAKPEDAEDIAKLIKTDHDIGDHYDQKVLADQLRSRLISKTGRSLVIRENGLIIAHTSTYAETKDIAVIGGTVVHPDYRNTDCFMRITFAIQRLLYDEGKKAYTFAINDKTIKYHKKLHTVCCEYGKMEIEKEK